MDPLRDRSKRRCTIGKEGVPLRVAGFLGIQATVGSRVCGHSATKNWGCKNCCSEQHSCTTLPPSKPPSCNEANEAAVLSKGADGVRAGLGKNRQSKDEASPIPLAVHSTTARGHRTLPQLYTPKPYAAR